MKTLKLIWKNKDLRNKLLIVIAILFGIRILSGIPTPGVNRNYFKLLLAQNSTLNFFNAISGNGLSNLSIMALSITPYITASIIIQLLGVIFPQVKELQQCKTKADKRKYEWILVFSGAGLACLESLTMAIGFGRKGLLTKYKWYYVLLITVIWTIMTTLTSIIGKIISVKLVGNGISLILVSNILSSYPSDSANIYEVLMKGKKTYIAGLHLFFLLILITALFIFTVWLQDTEKKIPVTYSGKLQGKSTFKGVSTNTIPIKLCPGGVVPIIFASSLISFPILIAQIAGAKQNAVLKLLNSGYWFNTSKPWYTFGALIYLVLIFAFSYFYTEITMNPEEIANNIKKKHTVYKVVHPEHIEIYSIIRPRNKEKGKEEDFFEIIKLIPDYMDMRFFMPNNMDQFYFKSEMKTKGIVSCEKFRKAQITDKQINEIEDVGFFMQLIDPKKHSAFILIPSKNFFTPFCRKLGIGKVNYGINPFRDIYLASRLKDANPFVIVYRTNDPATYGKAFTCFSEKTVKIEQSCIFDYKDALTKIEPNIIRSWQYTHTRTDIDFSYPARSINLKQKCKITLGTRLSFSDIGECAFRLQNCIFTNGGTILLPQEASRKKSNKLSPEGIVKDYNSQCYMKFDKIMEQLKSYETIPVTDMQQSVWNILEKLKFSSAFGFSNTRDLQKKYLSTFEKEGDALDVVIKILKIPGVLQRNYPGTTHDRVNECIGKIFNLKMEKLIV